MSMRSQGSAGKASGPSQARSGLRRVSPPPFQPRPLTAAGSQASRQNVEQLDERAFALAADEEVDVRRAQHRRGVEGREVAAPHDGKRREALLEPAREGHRRDELRAGHHRHRDERHGIVRARARPDTRRDLRLEVGIRQVSVEDLPRDAGGQRRAEREEREREAPVLRARGARVEEEDHARLRLSVRPTGRSARARACREAGP